MFAEAWEEAKRRKEAKSSRRDYSDYRHKPVEFCEEVLKCILAPKIKDVMRSVNDNTITVAQSCNSYGKSHGAGRVGVWWMKVHDEYKVFMTAAPPFENLKKILWAEFNTALNTPGVLDDELVYSLDVFKSSDKIDRENFVTGVAIPQSGKPEERETKFSGKHSPNLLFIVDEGDAVPEEVYKGIESCMSGGNVKLLIMFNPKMQSGYVYNLIKDKKAHVVTLSAFEHPNVVTGKDVIPGAVDREVTIRRINEWTRPLAEGEKLESDCFEVPEFLVGITAKDWAGVEYPPLKAGWRKITEIMFSYMVLGQYPSQGAMALISEQWISDARNRWDLYVSTFGERPPKGVKPLLGLDVGELGPDYNMCCIRWGGYVPKFNSKTMWNGLDTDQTAMKCYQLYVDNDVDMAFIDATGYGSSVAPSMVRHGRADSNQIRAVSVKSADKPTPFITTELGSFSSLRDQLWWAMREWLRTDPNAMLPPDPALLDDLRAAEYQVVGDKIKIMEKAKFREKLRRSPDRADALSLTFTPIEKPKVLRLVV